MNGVVHEWVLILTLLSYYNGTAMSVEHVPAFHSRAACLAAGNAWLRDVRSHMQAGASRARALCVRTGGTQ